MASSSQSNYHSEPAKIEQIITEFFAKSLHIILESRSPPCASSRNYSGEQILSSPSSSSSSSSSVRPRDKWFNLALRECPAALENLDLWHQSNLEPMVVDVILIQRPVDLDSPVTWSPRGGGGGGGGGGGLVRNLSSKERFPNSWNSSSRQDEFLPEMNREKIIERWVVQYENRKSRVDTGAGNKRAGGISSHSLYKKSIILLRSLYLTVRLLPAYKLFQDLNSSSQILNFSLTHRVSSLVEPFTPRDEAEMQQFGFTPVDTSCGRLCLSVLYRATLSDVNSEPSTPISPQFIPDYVGSPTTDPLKRFPSLPLTRLGSHGSPSSVPFSRRHSWSYDISRASAPLRSLSPSPTYSDSRALSSNRSSRCLPPLSLPCHPHETPRSSNESLANKNTSFDEYWPSPMLSPSLSPSPPTHLQGVHLSKALLRSESAPVSIPTIKLGRSPTILNSHALPPSPPRGPRTGSSQTNNVRNLISLGNDQTGLKHQKINSSGKDEAENHFGARISSNISPKISYSRSFSKLSFQDVFDDSDFPFAVDDEDITDPRPGSESFDGKGHLTEPGGLLPVRKSHDAAVGALVQMLKTAPPLRQDFSNSIKSSQVFKPEVWSKGTQEPHKGSQLEAGGTQNSASDINITSSGLLLLKTTSEALEELQSYKEMRNLLLRQGSGSQKTSSNVGHAAETAERS